MNKGRLFATISMCSIATASLSVVAFTFAAYRNANQYELPIDANTVNVSAEFTNGGLGTLASPYLISNSTDLRALQKLNVLGLFSRTNYFRLNADISYSGTPLLPIGSEDYPFYSQFDGNGYTITNLMVDGANTTDVGMFGYVALGAEIKNFVLQTPTVNITSNNVGSIGYAPNANPMESILSTAGTNIGELTFTNTTPARFTVPRTTVTGTDSATYTIVYQSTDTSLLYEYTPGVWRCGQPNTQKPTSIYPVGLIARVFALYNNYIVSYTLERWQINVKGNGTVEPGSSTVLPGYFKCVHNTTYPHETYVGLFAGHLDGAASFLGMYGGNASGTSNGTITVNGRNARSYSCLIGYSRLDNPLDDAASNMDQRILDFDTIIPENNLLGTSYSILEGANPITNYATQYSRSIAASMAYGMTADDVEVTRFYPALANTSINYTYPDLSTDTFNVMRWNAPLGVGVREDYLSYRFHGGPLNYGWFRRDATARNALWVWMNSSNNAFGKRIISSTSYEVLINFDYVAFSNSTANNFQIFYNAYNPDLLPDRSNRPPHFVRDDHWINLGQAWVDGTLVYNPSLHPIVTTNGGGTTSGVLTSHTVSFIINRSQDFWNSFSRGTYYPLFAIGIGKGNPIATDNNISPTYHYNYDDFTADAFEINILRMDIRFTSKDGDVSSQTTNIDYLYELPVRSTDFVGGTYIAWSSSSNVKVQFNVSNYAQNTAGTTYKFFRQYNDNLLYTDVNVLYSNATAFAPFNTENYDVAILTGV